MRSLSLCCWKWKISLSEVWANLFAFSNGSSGKDWFWVYQSMPGYSGGPSESIWCWQTLPQGGRKVATIGEEGLTAVPSEATSSQSAVTVADSPIPTGHVKLQPMLETIHLLDLNINEYST